MNKETRIQKIQEIIKRGKFLYEIIIPWKGEKKMKVYEIPLECLIYNQHNGRIASHVKSWEKSRQKIDFEKHPDDKQIIEDFLWNSKSKSNERTKQDIKDSWQKKPGIVTEDGIVIDGNRRFMILNKLLEETGDGKFGHFRAIILDCKIEDEPREIRRLETTYQMGEDSKVDYEPIEKYLKCKELKLEDGFTEKEIAKMMGEEEANIKEYLEIMKLMDDYLETYGYDGIYTRLEKREGQLRDLNNYFKSYKNKESKIVQWDYTNRDVNRLKNICFDYIRAQYEGKEFRVIGRGSKEGSFFCNKKIWKDFSDQHQEKIDEEINRKEKSVKEFIEQYPSSMNVETILQQRDNEWESNAIDSLKYNIKYYQDKLEDQKERNAPVKLLNAAISKIDAINTKDDAFFKDLVFNKIKELEKKSFQLEKEFKQK